MQVDLPVMAVTAKMMGAGILLGLAVIGALLWFVLNLTRTQAPQEKLVTLVSMGYVILIGIFIVDKVVAVQRDLISDTESATLFTYIKDISTLVFGYYFGTQTKEKNG